MSRKMFGNSAIAGNMAKIGWRELEPADHAPNMHTIKHQPVFVRPEAYQDSMDLSLMLAWNAQCTYGERREQQTQAQVFKVDKLRGPGVGTGDAEWKGAARTHLATEFSRRSKDSRINELQAEIAELSKPSPVPRSPIREAPRFPRSNLLVSVPPPVAALVPERVGSPGTHGVRQQLMQQEKQHHRLLAARGLPPSAPKVTTKGVPEGFHDPPGRTVAASHKHTSLTRPFNHHDVAPKVDHRNMTMRAFTAQWRPSVPQRRVHSNKDLG